jgi:hypothetical protein
MPPHASKPICPREAGADCIFLKLARRLGGEAQLYVKLPQLRRNGTVIKVSNLRVPRE